MCANVAQGSYWWFIIQYSLFTRAFLLPLGNIQTLHVPPYRLLLASAFASLALPSPRQPRVSLSPFPAPGDLFLLLELLSCSWSPCPLLELFSCSCCPFLLLLFVLSGQFPLQVPAPPAPGKTLQGRSLEKGKGRLCCPGITPAFPLSLCPAGCDPSAAALAALVKAAPALGKGTEMDFSAGRSLCASAGFSP